MQPLSGALRRTGGDCIPNPARFATTISPPSTASTPSPPHNLSNFPGKQLTAANTISIQGTVTFRTGYGMQGVNVVARPLDANGNPLYEYTVTSVSGALFSGNHGNPITGFTDSNGNPAHAVGLERSSAAGHFRPQRNPAAARRDHGQLSAHLRVHRSALHPHQLGRPLPARPGRALGHTSIHHPPQPLRRQHANPQRQRRRLRQSAAIKTPSAHSPRRAPCPPAACGVGRLSQVGQTDWFSFPVRGNRTFTVVTQALDETGAPTESKAMPSIGVWDAFDPVGATAVGAAPGLNGLATGETWLRVSSIGRRHRPHRHRRPARRRPPRLRLQRLASLRRHRLARAPARLRRSHRHSRHGLSPCRHGPRRRPARARHQHLAQRDHRHRARPQPPASPAQSTLKSTTCPLFYAAAVISGGISYDSGTGDALTLVTAPSNTVPIGVPIPFTVTALDSDAHPRRRRHRHLHRHQRHGHARLRSARSAPSPPPATAAPPSTSPPTDGNLVHRHRLAHQRLQPPGAIRRRNSARSLLAHAAAFARRRSHLHLDRPGARPLERHFPPPASPSPGRLRPGRHRSLRLRPPPSPTPRHRHQRPHRRPARRGPDRHHQRLPQRNQPVRRLHRLRRASRVRIAPSRSPATTQTLADSATPSPDRPPPPRHGRQSHGRRHGRALSGSLRLGPALRPAHRLPPRRSARHPIRHRHLGHRRHGHLLPGHATRRRHQPHRPRRLRQHRHRHHRHPAAPLAPAAIVSCSCAANPCPSPASQNYASHPTIGAEFTSREIMPLSGEAIRLMNYIDDVAVTLRRVLAISPHALRRRARQGCRASGQGPPQRRGSGRGPRHQVIFPVRSRP